jgi:hypothetical protein
MTKSRLVCLLVCGALTLCGANAFAQLSLPPDRVEEDWQLVVASPDPLGVGPQITTCMSPTGDTSLPFVAFDMNYREFPSFSPGGLQTQVWSGGTVTTYASQGSSLFTEAGETVTWTQRMSLSAGTLTYSISSGSSTTWGTFGQGSLLNVNFATAVPSLVAYDPDKSAARSGASWESDRVTSLTLVRVRYYAAGQLLRTDNNARVVVNNPAVAAAGD